MKFDMRCVKVMIAMPTHRDLPPATCLSLLETQGILQERNIESMIEINCWSSLVHHARSKAAYSFLKGPCTHLFWIDSDITWKGADFLRLLAIATKLECVSGIYTCKTDEPRFCLNVSDVNAVMATNEYGCLSVPGGGLGLGFTCVQRKVMEKLAERAPKVIFEDISDKPIPHIFRCDDTGEKPRGEDIVFFNDVRDAGYTVYLDPSITLGHIGPKEYKASILNYLTRVNKAA